MEVAGGPKVQVEVAGLVALALGMYYLVSVRVVTWKDGVLTDAFTLHEGDRKKDRGRNWELPGRASLISLNS